MKGVAVGDEPMIPRPDLLAVLEEFVKVHRTHLKGKSRASWVNDIIHQLKRLMKARGIADVDSINRKHSLPRAWKVCKAQYEDHLKQGKHSTKPKNQDPVPYAAYIWALKSTASFVDIRTVQNRVADWLAFGDGSRPSEVPMLKIIMLKFHVINGVEWVEVDREMQIDKNHKIEDNGETVYRDPV